MTEVNADQEPGETDSGHGGGSSGGTCRPCRAAQHAASDCADANKPMIARRCVCRHGRDSNPAPYWTGEQR